MKRSTERILTTHTGSLPRPSALASMPRGEAADPAMLEQQIASAVADVVRRQVSAGITVINDGEQSKVDWARDTTDRIKGFEGPPSPMPLSLERADFPAYFNRIADARAGTVEDMTEASCTGPLGWRDFSPIERDIARLKAATADAGAADRFLSSASPGTIANYHPNRHYKTREAYLAAIADVMKREYEAIANAGFILNIDCPDLTRQMWFPEMSLKDWRNTVVTPNIEALNHATRDIPAEQMRMHVCWGSNTGPHTRDVELADIVDLLVAARPIGMSVVAANGRHAHEWEVWRETKLPDGKIIIAGVIDPTTSIVEHPRTVAQRIIRYTRVLGPESVIAGVDCGLRRLDGDVVWAKLRSLAEGAALVTKKAYAA